MRVDWDRDAIRDFGHEMLHILLVFEADIIQLIRIEHNLLV